MRTIRLHDTRSGAPIELVPRDPGRVSIYTCGPTVYDRVHVGNARPYVVFSLLARFLAHEGLDVTLAINVTDINDKIYAAARERGVPSAELAREMIAAYEADTDALELGRPDLEPKATETIEPIVELISTLIEREHAYAADGDVYFAVRSHAAYGELSHRQIEDMDQGEGGEGALRKRDPLDFALWKAHKPGEDTAWDAPWGRGRPGWHIECSAMAEALLGLEFDIHGGGNDLTFPHHENEAAQTAAARGRPLARLWMHNGMIQLDRDTMSKSTGNVFVLHRALEAYGRDVLVMYFCAGHYHQPLAFDDEHLENAARAVARVREAARRLVPGAGPPELHGHHEEFFDALAEDFNTPRALAAVFGWIREANARDEPAGDADLRDMLDVLGLAGLLDAPVEAPPDERAVELLDARERARAAREWAEADRLRDELGELGWDVRDGPAGPELLARERA